MKAAHQCSLLHRQNYNREASRFAQKIGCDAHAKQFQRLCTTLRTLRLLVERVYRDINVSWARFLCRRERHSTTYWLLLDLTSPILTQLRKVKNKWYALHAPEVECIPKGKTRTAYEFGLKVSIVWTLKEGVVVGPHSMPSNPVDGHLAYEALEQAAILSGITPRMAFVDRGYRGVEVLGVQIWKSGQRRQITRGLKALIKNRSAIEPTIGYMNNNGKLRRIWLKRTLADAMHAVLCGAGYNIRLIINNLKIRPASSDDLLESKIVYDRLLTA